MPLRLKSLSTELTIVFASIVVVLILTLSYFAFSLVSQSAEETLRRDLLNAVDMAVLAIDKELQERVRDVETAVLSPTIRDAAIALSEEHTTIPLEDRNDEGLRKHLGDLPCPSERPEVVEHLSAIQSAHSYISGFLLTDRFGITIGCTYDPHQLVHFEETWWQESVKRGVSLSNLELDDETGTYYYAVALPIHDGRRSPAGVLRAIFNLKAVQDSIATMRIGEHGYLMAMGRTGRVIAHRRSEFLWKRVEDLPELSFLVEVVNARNPRGVLIFQPPERSGDQGDSIDGAAPSHSPARRASLAKASEDSWFLAYARMFRPASLGPLGWTVVGTVSRSEVIAPILAIRNRVAAIAGTLLPVAILLVWFVSRRLALPLHDLAHRADLIAAGNLSVRLTVPPRNEIARLASAMSSMVDSLQESNRSLAQTNDNLEKTVAERTQEIKEKGDLLEQQSKQVLEASRLKSQFLANMSHELRTPLNAILALSEILAQRISGDLNEEQVKQVTIINRSGQNLLRLINDILDLSKIEAGRIEVHTRNFALRHIVNAIKDTIEPLASEKNLKFEVTVDPALPGTLRADEEKIRQVAVNLLGNAVKFTQEGSVSLVLSRRHRALPGSDELPPPLTDEGPFWLELKVEDTGIGISPDQVGKIFDEFQQADGSATRKYGGSGLGLAICKKLVELMGGEIYVASTLGRGSTFRALLPVEGMASAQPGAGSAPGHQIIARTKAGGGISTPAETGSPMRQEDSEARSTASPGEAASPSVTRAEEARGSEWHPPDASAPPHTASAERHETSSDASLRADSPESVRAGARKWVTPLREHPIPISPRFLDIRDDTHNLLPHIPTLLVVDDDPESLYVYRQFLSRKGYQVIFAINGEQVIDKARQFKPVAIILDLMLPQKSGWEVLEDLKITEDLSNLPVIIASVLDHRERGLCAGAFRYLTKPMSERQLSAVLDELEKARKKNVRRVLVIDDDPVEIGIARTLFEKAGLDVITEQNGAKAVELAAAEMPDFIVLDLLMPEMDGFEVLSRLKADARTQAIPVLVYTAKDITEEDRRRLLPSAREIFPKVPLRIEEMLEEIQRALQTVPVPAIAERSEEPERAEPAGSIEELVGEGTGARAEDSMAETSPVRVAGSEASTTGAGSRGTRAQESSWPDDGASQSLKAASCSRPAFSHEGPRARILLVEDDPANQYSVSFMLRSQGYEVLLAENGREGLEVARRERPDLILMDMMMPVMSGFDATRTLKQDSILGAIPVIALTAAAMLGDRERTLAAGCDDYVSKPIERERLLERVRYWLARAEEEEPAWAGRTS